MSFERFFSDINYSAANEDGRVEHRVDVLGHEIAVGELPRARIGARLVRHDAALLAHGLEVRWGTLGEQLGTAYMGARLGVEQIEAVDSGALGVEPPHAGTPHPQQA